MTGSTAIDIAQRALFPLGLFTGTLGADVIKALEDDATKAFTLTDGRRVLVKDGRVEVVPVNPKGF